MTVDLTDRYPTMVPTSERAKRLAEDPVAAADFFQFCVTNVFEHLFGWNYKKKESSVHGGILGHLSAFYGTSEFTECGNLHGHFLIWLVGGLNPADIHTKLKQDKNFEKHLFSFFEDVIQHHLPDVELTIDKNYEPRIECPPHPPKYHPDMDMKVLEDWDRFMDSEVKILGEILQRHRCMEVCHKYGNKEQCRFQFPHDIEPMSYFDPNTNSVVLKCLDSMINYFNKYILVFCRHNHDIKSILSGKAAKAAMFYITDYITKMDVKTYEVLSLLSRAVVKMPESPIGTTQDCAKMLLHKCLAQFTRQQQIHAQQAARYLRGFDDSIKSHETIPMMSNLLLELIKSPKNSEHIENIDYADSDDTEPAWLSIHTDHNGKLLTRNQVLDYFFRSETLKNMNFYEFCRCVRLEKIKQNDINNENKENEPRLGTLTRHTLKKKHPLHETHEHTDEGNGSNQSRLIPRVVGCSITRSNSNERWMLFALAHFKPFDCDHPLITDFSSQKIQETYENYNFSPRSQYIMKNWDAVHECQDECDAE